MHHHFEQRDGGDTDGGEVVRVGTPWAGIRDGFLGIIGIGVEGVTIRIDELYGVFEL